MSFGENPALIGGIRIKVGSDVYDGSIRASSRRWKPTVVNAAT